MNKGVEGIKNFSFNLLVIKVVFMTNSTNLMRLIQRFYPDEIWFSNQHQ